MTHSRHFVKVRRMKSLSFYSSLIGTLLIVSDDSYLYSLSYEEQKYPSPFLEVDVAPIESGISLLTKKWLDEYFLGKEPSFSLPISLENLSSFRQRVYRILMGIPYGKWMSYKEIAMELERETGKRVSYQAVGGAVAHNPIAIIIPCHRVLGVDGSLKGYNGGKDKKRKLLQIEGISF